MSAIDISKLKNKWMGIWNPSVRYLTNDIVQFRGSSFVCIKDIPDEQVMLFDASITTTNYDGTQPRIHLKQIEIADEDYWQLMAPGMPFKRTWSPMTSYHPGDIVEAAGDLFICIQYGYNRYIANADFWTKIFESADRDQRNQCAVLFNNNPIGWQYNMGDKWWPTETPIRSYGFLGFDGNVYMGGAHRSPTAIGSNFNGVNYNFGWKIQGFTHTDWLQSNQALGASANFTTPTGEPPKCIQWALGSGDDGTSLFLMDNGELYAAGIGTSGQLGQGNVTNYFYPVRVRNTATTDYLGNTIRPFSTTKIVKCGLTAQGWEQGKSSQSAWALGDDGTVWAWGYNAYGQLSFGSELLTASVGAAQTDQTNVRRIPSSFFDHKKIVDIMPAGGNYGRCFFLDEDGYLWHGGVDFAGGSGSGNKRDTTTGDYYRIQTPQRIGINWKKHGGMKKLITTDSAPYREMTFILDGDGYIWTAGRPQNSGQHTWHSVANNNTTDTGTSGFIRIDKDWYAEHEIENFWFVGGINQYNLYFREKGTGITYVAGGNITGQLGQYAHHRLGGATFSPTPKYLRGPRYAKQIVTFTSGHSNPAPTVCVVTDDGQAWGNGQNDYGSLSFGYAGSAGRPPSNYWAMWYKDVSGQNQFRRCSQPPGLRVMTVGGFGWSSNYDGSIWQMDDGSVMICGTDGDASYQLLQNNDSGIDTAPSYPAYPAYVMHGLSGH